MTNKEIINEKKYSIKETTRFLGEVSTVTVWREIKRGKLKHYQIGGRILIGEHHIENYLSCCEKNGD
jgi:hypothetical protein